MTDPTEPPQPSQWEPPAGAAPAAPPPGWPAAPQPPKKKHTGRNILIGVAVVVVLAAIGGALGSNSDKDKGSGNGLHGDRITSGTSAQRTSPTNTGGYTDPDTGETPSDEPDGPTLLTPGATLHITNQDGVDGIVTLSKPKPVTADPYDTPEHGRYVAVWLAYKSNSGTFNYNEFDWQAEDAEGNVYDPSFSSSVSPSLNSGELHSGQKVSGWVTFDVGKAKITKIAFAPNYGDDVVAYWQVNV